MHRHQKNISLTDESTRVWSAFKVNQEKGEVVLNVKLDQLQPAVEATDAKDKSPSVQKLVKDVEADPGGGSQDKPARIGRDQAACSRWRTR
jgi:hypothetical protein